MRDRIDQWFLFAMVIVEALRGIGDLRHYLRWARIKANVKGRANPATRHSWKRRSQEWAAFAFVFAVALVPTLYYAAHAALA